jgi:hypothetical protein
LWVKWGSFTPFYLFNPVKLPPLGLFGLLFVGWNADTGFYLATICVIMSFAGRSRAFLMPNRIAPVFG